MRPPARPGNFARVAEGLSATEVGKEIAEHRERGTEFHARHERIASIVEALLLSVVALLAAWSGYSAAKWGTESRLDLSTSSRLRTQASVAEVEALQIRTIDSVSFNAVFTAYTSHDPRAFRVAVRRLRPGYRPAFNAWLATHPLVNPNAPLGPAYMPQYKIPQDVQAKTLNARATAASDTGEADAGTGDKYVRLTVFLAAVLFLVGIGSRFTVRVARFGLIGVAAVLLIVSVVQLLGLPGPP